MNFKEEMFKQKEAMIKDTCELLSIPSVLDKYNAKSFEAPFGTNIKKALDFMLNKAIKDGFKTYNASNYAGHIEYGEGEDIVGILCHLDVVPANYSNAFSPYVRDNRIYGRGSIDDKGPIMAVYYALKTLKDMGIKLNKRVRLILGCDEESGMRCIEKYLEIQEEPTMSFSPDADFPLIYGEKGHCTFYLEKELENTVIEQFIAGDRLNVVPNKAETVLSVDARLLYEEYLIKNDLKGEIIGNHYIAYGVSAHAMHPNKGINAGIILLKFLDEILHDEVANMILKITDYQGQGLGINSFDEEMGALTLNLGVVKTIGNTISFGIDIRFPKDEDEKNIKESLSKTTFSVKSFNCTNVHYVSPTSTLVSILHDSYRRYVNDDSKPYTIGGGTYSRKVKNCVAFGPSFPNREDVVHQDNEYIIIDDLLLASTIYLDAIYALGSDNNENKKH